MTTKTMLIDASHPEETRVAVLSGNRLEDFDVEAEARKQIKGNIYLAKVIRVEPSLQAAFVDYGGNRHGFLSFSEIHPDYYQVPIEDREALLEEHNAEEKAEGNAEDAESNGDAESTEKTDDEGSSGEEKVETIGGDDTDEARPKRSEKRQRRYKIQEVIKRRQILLIQVVKEERGNKGAALTTYISLAGRYCVLMPNTARGGGISRKITNGADRKQLKAILTDLNIPQGFAVIVRTAGIKRGKAEIKRDYEYLMRLWDKVRLLTLESTAPNLVHEEANLIKRSIRDLYSRDIENIIVSGDTGYRLSKDFMKLLIPSHAKRVQPYKETTKPLFQHYGVESQLEAIHSTTVQLPSGGYIVINPTEALVSIDVNSGRSTRERNIEATALKTNLEAADEVARQLRLRDLAGLIVIDFIDMDVSRNNHSVERRMKDAMREDRARIQIGRISPFGLLELSRQRLRMSLLETSSEPCPHCSGSGILRSTDSSALVALRAVEEEANRKKAKAIILHVPTAVALYILNQKRPLLAEFEELNSLEITVTADESLIPPDLRIERVREDGTVEAVSITSTTLAGASDDKPGKRRRRGGRNRKSADSAQKQEGADATPENQDGANASADSDEETTEPKRRRRGRRGGRRRRGKSSEQAEAATQETSETQETGEDTAPPSSDAADSGTDTDADAAPKEEKKKPASRRRSRAKKADSDTDETATQEPAAEAAAEGEEASEEKPKEKPKRTRKPRTRKAAPKDDAKDEAKAEAKDDSKSEKKSEAKPARKPRTRKAAPKKDSVAKEPVQEPSETVVAAAKTTVINIDEGAIAAKAEDKPKRGGWWKR